MSRIFLLLLIIFGVILFLRVRRQPDVFKTERARKIDATPTQLKALLADFSKDIEWNPFMRDDPDLHYEISENPSGVGAKMNWRGKRAGAGETEILEVDNHHVKRSLIMLKPMRADNIVNFTFELDGDQTLLTWSMSGKMTTTQKFFQAIVSSDKMIGGAFDQGLDQIEAYFKE